MKREILEGFSPELRDLFIRLEEAIEDHDECRTVIAACWLLIGEALEVCRDGGDIREDHEADFRRILDKMLNAVWGRQ